MTGADLQTVVRDLNEILFQQHGYAGDVDTYDDLDNANLMRVIDRRRGLPVAISILYIHVARAAGLDARGLSFPGHFVIQIDRPGERVILDPFNGGLALAADDLRGMLKVTQGSDAELIPDHYRAVADVEILLRLENNIKLRLIQQDRSADAAVIVDRMRLLAPETPDLMREAGLLHAHAGNLRAAIEALEAFLDRETLPGARRDAAALLERLRTNLN